jgi:hypothetical protein
MNGGASMGRGRGDGAGILLQMFELYKNISHIRVKNDK